MSDDATPIDALIAQGCCCGTGCENCPYTPPHEAGAVDLDQKWINFHTTHPGTDITRDKYIAMETTGTLPA